jgi:DNA-binding NtrC family response regulator
VADPKQLKIERVIAVTNRRDGNPALTRLSHLATDARIALDVKDSLEEAAAALLLGEDAPGTCLLVDAACAGELRSKLRSMPHLAVIVFASEVSAPTAILAMREGAFDVVDLHRETDAAALGAIERALVETHERQERRKRLSAMRGVVEDFLRVLVKAERRSIELEDKLRSAESGEMETVDGDPDRPPCVLVVDDDLAVVDLMVDVLQRDGLATRSAATGEQAIEEVAATGRAGDWIDLLLIDKNLPDVDGLRVIARVAELDPGIAAMVMTGFASTESAIDAADLGVVGYLLKPFDDIPSICRRVRESATRSMNDRRERRYLDRIKDRHSEFLLRYRKLAAQFDKLG